MLWLYKSLKFIFRYLVPENSRYFLARWIGRGVVAFNPARRRVILSNLTPLLGLMSAKRIAPVLMGHFAMTAVDFFCPRPGLTDRVVFENESLLDRSYRKYKRIVLVTAHVGNWELGMSWLVEKGYAVAGVYAPYRNDEIVRWILAHRHAEVEWIPASRGAIEAGVHALQRGRVLGMVADIPFGEQGQRVSLAGYKTHLPLGPWAIALRAEAVVLPAFLLRTKPGHYRGKFFDPIIPSPVGSFRNKLVGMQEIFRQHLEHTLLECPEQWGVLQPFWN